MFNPRAHAYILYMKVADIDCQERLINRFRIPERGARIGIQDLDLLVAETPGGKDELLLEHPWLGIGYPIMVIPRTGRKFYGFKDIVQELIRYHEYLDNYHASLQEMKLPNVAPTHTLWPSGRQPAPRVTAPRPSPGGQQQEVPEPKQETKKQAEAEVGLPPAQKTRVGQPPLIKPEPMKWDEFVQGDQPIKGKAAKKVVATPRPPDEPRLSEQVKQNDPGMPREEVVYVDENGQPIPPEQALSPEYAPVEQETVQKEEEPIEAITPAAASLPTPAPRPRKRS